MSDLWAALLTLGVIGMPLGLAWLLLGRAERRRPPPTLPRPPSDEQRVEQRGP